ncbi:MAG: type III pantothenate kinase [Clostridiales bacterium]|nr:type III pantothenate kinase [Clostridiales bacterium]
MLLVINVGNTNIILGAYEGKRLLNSWRLATDKEKTSDEFGVFFTTVFGKEQLPIESVEAVIIASVVPPVMYSLEHSIRKYFLKEPIIIGPGIKTGINIKYENPRELGADRIVNAVAAYDIYGGPIIVVDFGTATTFNAISSRGEFLGGCICPGIKIAAEALYQKTAKLPRIDLIKTESVIARNTANNMQTGIYNGYIGQVNHIIAKMKSEMKEDNIKVIATGGFGRILTEGVIAIDELNSNLTLEGLRIIYEKNKSEM